MIPDGKTKIPYASWAKNQNIKQNKCRNRFNEDLKMVHIKQKMLKINKQKL